MSRGEFIPFQCGWLLFLSFLIILTRTSRATSNTVSDSGHPCVVLDVDGKELACGLVTMGLTVT